MALVAHAGGALARAVGRQLLEPVEDRAVASVLVNQPVQRIATESSAGCSAGPKNAADDSVGSAGFLPF